MHSIPSEPSIARPVPSRLAAACAILLVLWLGWTNLADLADTGREATASDRFGHLAGLNQGWSLFAYRSPPRQAVFLVAVMEFADGSEVQVPSEFLPSDRANYYRSPLQHPRIFLREYGITAQFEDDNSAEWPPSAERIEKWRSSEGRGAKAWLDWQRRRWMASGNPKPKAMRLEVRMLIRDDDRTRQTPLLQAVGEE